MVGVHLFQDEPEALLYRRFGAHTEPLGRYIYKANSQARILKVEKLAGIKTKAAKLKNSGMC